MTRVITGNGKNLPQVSERNARVALSLSEDICVAATGGKWKMPKHLLLGMALRHFTGSVHIITLISIKQIWPL